MFNNRNALFALVLLACGAACSARAAACGIPVFRYALERWSAEAYQVVVFHRGELDPSELEIVGALKQAASENGGDSNFTLRVADLDSVIDEATRAQWRAQESNQVPRVVIAYPAPSPMQGIVWSGPLSQATVKAITTSPLRKEVARYLQDGETGVWVLLESGDVEKDTAAARLLEAELAKMPDQLTFPDFSSEPLWTGSSLELKISFPLIRLSRTDPDEAVFRAMLLGSEEDLKRQHAAEPLAFLLFGRARTLYALVGRGINKENVKKACEFLVGPCACVIKADNPGVDMLVSASWDAALETPLVREIVLPPLTSVSAQASESETPIEGTVAPTAPQSAPAEARSHRLLWGILIALGLIVVAVAVLSVVTWKRSSVK